MNWSSKLNVFDKTGSYYDHSLSICLANILSIRTENLSLTNGFIGRILRRELILRFEFIISISSEIRLDFLRYLCTYGPRTGDKQDLADVFFSFVCYSVHLHFMKPHEKYILQQQWQHKSIESFVIWSWVFLVYEQHIFSLTIFIGCFCWWSFTISQKYSHILYEFIYSIR